MIKAKQNMPAWVGLTPKEWNDCLDGYLFEGTMSVDCWERMDEFQISVIGEIKKAKSRKSMRCKKIE